MQGFLKIWGPATGLLAATNLHQVTSFELWNAIIGPHSVVVSVVVSRNFPNFSS